MLLGDGERPARSGMKQAATEATNDLILDLRRAVAELWGARADAIKAACAPHVPTGGGGRHVVKPFQHMKLAAKARGGISAA